MTPEEKQIDDEQRWRESRQWCADNLITQRAEYRRLKQLRALFRGDKVKGVQHG